MREFKRFSRVAACDLFVSVTQVDTVIEIAWQPCFLLLLSSFVESGRRKMRKKKASQSEHRVRRRTRSLPNLLNRRANPSVYPSYWIMRGVLPQEKASLAKTFLTRLTVHIPQISNNLSLRQYKRQRVIRRRSVKRRRDPIGLDGKKRWTASSPLLRRPKLGVPCHVRLTRML